MSIIIQGRESPSHPWGQVDPLRKENEFTDANRSRQLVNLAAHRRLVEWNLTSADHRGAFTGWDFRIAEVQS